MARSARTYRSALRGTILAAYRPNTRRPDAHASVGRWKLWSTRWSWVERAAEYDRDEAVRQLHDAQRIVGDGPRFSLARIQGNLALMTGSGGAAHRAIGLVNEALDRLTPDDVMGLIANGSMAKLIRELVICFDTAATGLRVETANAARVQHIASAPSPDEDEFEDEDRLAEVVRVLGEIGKLGNLRIIEASESTDR